MSQHSFVQYGAMDGMSVKTNILKEMWHRIHCDRYYPMTHIYYDRIVCSWSRQRPRGLQWAVEEGLGDNVDNNEQRTTREATSGMNRVYSSFDGIKTDSIFKIASIFRSLCWDDRSSMSKVSQWSVGPENKTRVKQLRTKINYEN